MQPSPLSGAQLLERFQALDSFLIAYQRLWRPKPFTHLQLPWESLHPELASWLRSRSLTAAEAADNHPELLAAPAPFPELAQQASVLSAVGALPSHPRPQPSSRLSSGVPGRKWQQISAFADCLQFQQAPQHWLDWCAGKGHLGRLLAQDGSALSCLEYDPALVAAGQQLSLRAGINAQHRLQDVFAADTSEHLQRQHTPVALHACGDLHIRLLQLASNAGCKQLAFAPCCYNRIHGDRYQPLSSAAQASVLQLSKEDLGLPLSETVTAGARIRRQRDSSMARRLAFDQLQRELTGIDHYLPTPSLPSAWLDKPFAAYCRDLAALKGLPPPTDRDWAALEAHGWQRLAQVRNLELLRALFRRPLELWLLLDRALYLQAQGYEVCLGSFCAPQLSPRNLLLLAERK
jgi:hypothetical protein